MGKVVTVDSFDSIPQGNNKVDTLVFEGQGCAGKAPDVLRTHSKVRKLVIKDTAITELPPLRRLEELEIHNSPITDIEICSSLKEVTLLGRDMPHLPEWMKNASIEVLSLANTQAHLLDEAGKIKSLRALLLHGMRLQGVVSFVEFSALTIIHIYTDKLLTALPDDWSKMRKLEVLGLRDTGVTFLPASLVKLPHFRKCIVQNNELRALPKAWDESMIEVEHLETNPLVKKKDLLKEGELRGRGIDITLRCSVCLALKPTSLRNKHITFSGGIPYEDDACLACMNYEEKQS